ncbi:hypothetical protein H112_02458 [Trichophyton rubrum D6]|uniref:Uncharacterized protein n=1 Tax=Trichophyton rubrum (strain ATCC MYA-4607 / CBS 118892) TaxID=559305 RepID=A0A080WVY7_TRIRC|nr:uncharacterized protein TERG_12383 [Trichophyton rubrum CBS 118892]EZF25191.1 hypothetical protein H100_02459 [Trichophyton rubrum MR850]EZF65491.1 hypothetical protein H104_02444 [Trichophyton rubrum CBS 289.86]EZF86779.1 hypothetical protein H110_02462 [Trichophyton rubrum MR1448]EZF97594.1 hypothetical protein H113_02473 [Trichophyton rubrum MR1459]EZG08499.1 hypothetical protein H106_02326 [Trichophyton rubrum CBS 735.88]KDB35982.1 hypothetical protein H112_02458 [Trichophyton rubrum D
MHGSRSLLPELVLAWARRAEPSRPAHAYIIRLLSNSKKQLLLLSNQPAYISQATSKRPNAPKNGAEKKRNIQRQMRRHDSRRKRKATNWLISYSRKRCYIIAYMSHTEYVE